MLQPNILYIDPKAKKTKNTNLNFFSDMQDCVLLCLVSSVRVFVCLLFICMYDLVCLGRFSGYSRMRTKENSWICFEKYDQTSRISDHDS